MSVTQLKDVEVGTCYWVVGDKGLFQCELTKISDSVDFTGHTSGYCFYTIVWTLKGEYTSVGCDTIIVHQNSSFNSGQAANDCYMSERLARIVYAKRLASELEEFLNESNKAVGRNNLRMKEMAEN